ncbi:VOC family protein [Piscinibacter sp.]|jgi:predicted enzyme related to lactoylglutathione lyase|uniref:VOC family protein n=1 Tax=Piscinibacter sp. TaxID=1903157 RepID=UPI002F40D417
MLTNSHLTTILPVVQVDRARRFYEEKLGLQPEGEHADGSFWMRTGAGDTVALIPRPDRKPAEYTSMSFEVDDIDSEIKDLERRGVKFEDYDLPNLKTVNHVFATPDEKCAWLTDTEGNILCLHENTRH